MARKSLKREEKGLDDLYTGEKATQRPGSHSETRSNPKEGSDSTITNTSETGRNQHTSPVTFQNGPESGGAPIENPDHGLHVLGEGVKRLVQGVQALRSLGVEDLNLPLPKIVVVGDQSTGKSSLIEGMSGIKVPRSSGTCTRCPLEINLIESSEDTWTCKIMLRKKYVYEGKLGATRGYNKNVAKAEGATRLRPLGPWVGQDTEEFHFATIFSKAEVEHALFLAQLAILNPSSSYEKYLPGNNSEPENGFQVKFSPNIIRLDISGSGLPNLSFYDLPGVINVSDMAGEEYLVDLVKNLVKSYITAEDCINLLAIPMTDDPANSSASKLVRDSKAEARTMGCLTKPDRFQEGESLEQWIQILNGQRFRLGFGYHVVKNNPDSRVAHAVARREEDEFFAEQSPWATKLNTYSARFGTSRLQAALSQHLTAQIRKSLPRITAQVEEMVEDLSNKLREFPEPLNGNLPVIVLGELMEFGKQVEKNFDGESQDNAFQTEWIKMELEFRQSLADSRPVLIIPTPRTPNESPSTSIRSETPTPRANAHPITIDSDDDEVLDEITPVQRSGNKRRLPFMHSSPNKMQRASNFISRSKISSAKSQSKVFDIAGIRRRLHQAYMDVPGQIHPKATEEMIKMSLGHWEHPMNLFLSQARELVECLVHKQVEKVLGHHQGTRYYDQIIDICRAFFEEAFADEHQLVNDLLNAEMTKPKTLNHEAQSIAREKALATLKSRLDKNSSLQKSEEQDTPNNRTSAAQARTDKGGRVTDTQGQFECYALELSAMSTVKAYYECAYSRFVDNVCMSIEYKVFSKCHNDIVNTLKQKLGVMEPGAHERFSTLLAVDPDKERQRTLLQKEKDTLQKALERLESLAREDLSR